MRSTKLSPADNDLHFEFVASGSCRGIQGITAILLSVEI